MTDLMKLLIVAIVMEGKGGVGKSLIAQLLKAALEFDGKNAVHVVDTDSTNSSMVQIFGQDNVDFVDFADESSLGQFGLLIDNLRDQTFHAAVIDSGARDEQAMTARIPAMLHRIGKTKTNAKIVVLRPITLSSHVQANAEAFCLGPAKSLEIPVVLVKNLGQGRKPADFAAWENSDRRKKCLEAGAAEIDLPNLGARWSDECSGFSLPIADVALANFDKVAAVDRAEAEKLFTPAVRMWFAEYLDDVVGRLQTGIESAIANKSTISK